MHFENKKRWMLNGDFKYEKNTCANEQHFSTTSFEALMSYIRDNKVHKKIC